MSDGDGHSTRQQPAKQLELESRLTAALLVLQGRTITPALIEEAKAIIATVEDTWRADFPDV